MAVELLINGGANLSLANNNGEPPLYRALQNGKYDKVLVKY